MRLPGAADFPGLPAALILLVLVLSPLPLGSARPLPEALLMLCSFAALFFWSVAALRHGHGQLLDFKKIYPLLAPAVLALLWALVQMASLSLDASATLIGSLKLAAYGTLFLLMTQAGRSPELARRILMVFVAAAAFYASFALAVYLRGNTTLLLFDKTAYLDSLTGPFVNRNAFAAWCGMGVIAATGVLIQQLRRALDDRRPVRLDAGSGLALLTALALLLCLFLSTSRAGLVSTGIALATLWLGLFINRTIPRKALILSALGALLLVGLVFIAAGPSVMARFSPDMLMKDDRPDIWQATLQMIRDHPLTGQGLNTYDQLLMTYRSEAISRSYLHAHSTYLELAAELGLPAALLFFTTLLLIGVRLLRGVLSRRQSAIYPIIALAVLVQAACHSLMDFSFQIPANAATLAILLGLGVAQSWSSRQHDR